MYPYFPTEEDNEDPPFCEDCGQPMEADADVDISDDTGRPCVSGWSAVCNNPDCPA
jgi:hypothetical protein